jgi:peptide/nickel transport system permease protein
VAVVSLGVVLLVVVVAAAAPLITKLVGVDPLSFNPKVIDDAGGLPAGRWGGISLAHPLGVEPGTGRDLFARLLYGSRISLLISFTGTFITLILGVTIGIIAGYSRGWMDTALGRLMDLILAFPLLLILLAMANVLTQRLETSFHLAPNVARVTFIILVLSLFAWPYLARIIRGQVLSLREREFVESAVAMGAGTPRILFKEILPNLWAPILVYATLLLPTFIAAEAALSYLGVGLLPPTPSWGAMLAESVSYFTVMPGYLFIPGTYLFVVVLSFNLLGDSIRDALDPRAGRG